MRQIGRLRFEGSGGEKERRQQIIDLQKVTQRGGGEKGQKFSFGRAKESMCVCVILV